MAQDRLILRDIVVYGYHGAFAAEKELGQRYEVDVELVLDLTQAGKNDDVELGVNAVDLYTIVKDIVEEQEFNLLEAVAEAIAGQILEMYDLKEVVVRVRKPHPPIGGMVGALEVEIRRTQG